MTAATIVDQSTRPPVTLGIKLAYGFGSAAFGAKNQLLGSLLLLFYNQIVGLPAHLVSIGLTCTIIFDAFWDPIVGQISDNWRSKWGRRHPFMYIAALPAAGALYMLFNPPKAWPELDTLGYMLVMVMLAKTTISLYEVPATALTPEMAPRYDERTRLLSYRYFFAAAASAGAAFMGYRFFLRPFMGPHGHKLPGQLNEAGYAPYALAVGAIMITSILVASIATHKFIPYLHQPAVTRPSVFNAVREMSATLSNRNFLVVTLAALLGGIGSGLGAGLQTYFSTYFWKLSSNDLSIIVLGAVLSSFLALIIAPAVSRALGKRNACVVVLLGGISIAIAPIGLRLIGIIPDSWIGTPSLVAFLTGDRIISGAMTTAGLILSASMIADVVEESQIKTGRRSEGLLLSADHLLQKIVGGLAAIIPGFMLTWVGMPRHADPATIDPSIMTNLAYMYLPFTALFHGLAIITLLLYRIDREAHERNLQRLREGSATAETIIERESIVPGAPGRPA